MLRGHRDGRARIDPVELIADLAREQFQRIATGQNRFDDLAIDAQFTLSHRIKQGLQLMRQFTQCGQMKKAGAPLEGVKGPEDGVDGVFVARLFFQDEHALLDVLKQLDRLAEELAQQFLICIDVQNERGGRLCFFRLSDRRNLS